MKNAKRTLFALMALLLLTSVLASCTPASVLGLPLLFPMMMPEDTGSPETTQPEPDENNPPAKPSVFDGIEFSDPAVVIPAAYALATGATMEGTYTLKGQIIETGAFNASDKDMHATIVVEGYEEYPIYCYYLKNCTPDVGVGDYVAVRGTIKNYKGTVEFERPELLAYEDGVLPPSIDITPKPGTGLAQGYNVITIEQAIEIARIAGETPTTERYYIHATVATVTNSAYGAMIIEDETGSISVYGTYSEDGSVGYASMTDKPKKGDEVLLSCTLHTFKNSAEVKNARVIKFNKVILDESAYTEMTIEAARNAKEGDLVKVSGTVAQITYASGMVPNGIYLVDDTNSIYVFDSDLAASVKVGQYATVLASKTWWILDTETSSANKFGYKGCNQLSDAWLLKTSGDDIQIPDYSKLSWIKETTVKDIVNTPFSNDITTTIYKVTALIKESVGADFTNYYVDDLDGVTGSYVYTQCNGNDLDWLKQYDGKICTVYLSVINAKSTATGCNWRFKVLDVIDEGFTFDKADAPQFAIDYYAKDQFEAKYTADPAQELITSVSSELLGFQGVTLSYSSDNTDMVYFETVDGKVIMHCGSVYGKAYVTITATLDGKTATKVVEVENAEAPKVNYITVADAIAAADETEVTVKGIVGPSLVNQKTGFYLFGEDGSMIAVRLVDATGFEGLSIGNEVILTGKRNIQKKDDTATTYYGQTCIDNATIIVNNKGNNEYSTKKFVTDKTIAEVFGLDATVDYSTTVFVLTGKLTFPTGNGQPAINDADGNKVSFYSSGSSQYSFLRQFEGQEVTLEIAMCNWNGKTYWRGCVLAVRLADGSKILNELNFTTN